MSPRPGPSPRVPQYSIQFFELRLLLAEGKAGETWRRSSKCKGKGHPRTGHEDPTGENIYSCTLSLTSALDGVAGQRHAPAALPSGKTRYQLYRWLGGSQGRSGRVRKNSPPQGFDTRTVQPLGSLYTDWAMADRTFKWSSAFITSGEVWERSTTRTVTISLLINCVYFISQGLGL